MATIKTSANLPESAVAALRELSEKRGTSMAEVLRQAISLEKFVDEQTSQGGKILIEKDNEVRQLLRS